MINYIAELFAKLFSSCLYYDYIILFLAASLILSVILTIVIYLVKGRY